MFLIGRSDSAHALAQIDANSAGAIDPGSNRLVDQVRVGAGPGRIAAGFGSLWVVNDFDSTVSRIDPASGSVQTIRWTAIRPRSRWERGSSGLRAPAREASIGSTRSSTGAPNGYRSETVPAASRSAREPCG